MSSTNDPILDRDGSEYFDSDTEHDEALLLSSRKEVTVVPPIGFALVGPGVYRSGHPFQVNFRLLKKLKLKTIIYLAEEDYPSENIAWCAENGVCFLQYRVKPVRSPAIGNDPVAMEAALKIIKDRSNHPVLLHSNKGKHRVGVLVGCMRKVLQGWDQTTIDREYSMFAGEKGQPDLQFIADFEPSDPALRSAQGWAVEWMRCSSRTVE